MWEQCGYGFKGKRRPDRHGQTDTVIPRRKESVPTRGTRSLQTPSVSFSKWGSFLATNGAKPRHRKKDPPLLRQKDGGRVQDHERGRFARLKALPPSSSFFSYFCSFVFVFCFCTRIGPPLVSARCPPRQHPVRSPARLEQQQQQSPSSREAEGETEQLSNEYLQTRWQSERERERDHPVSEVPEIATTKAFRGTDLPITALKPPCRSHSKR